MPLWKRKLSLMVGVAGGAAAISVLANAVGLGEQITVAVAGVGLALVIVIGGPWAFGDGRFAFQERNPVQPNKAAMVAGQEEHWKTLAYRELSIVQTLEDDFPVEGGPVVLPAGWASPRGPLIEGEADFVPVGNGVSHDADDSRD